MRDNSNKKSWYSRVSIAKTKVKNKEIEKTIFGVKSVETKRPLNLWKYSFIAICKLDNTKRYIPKRYKAFAYSKPDLENPDKRLEGFLFIYKNTKHYLPYKYFDILTIAQYCNRQLEQTTKTDK